jgi:hypothetical protein
VELAAGAPPQRHLQLPEAPGPPRSQADPPAAGSIDSPVQGGLPDGVAAGCSTPTPGQAAPVGYASGIACAVYVGIANGSFLVSCAPKHVEGLFAIAKGSTGNAFEVTAKATSALECRMLCRFTTCGAAHRLQDRSLYKPTGSKEREQQAG